MDESLPVLGRMIYGNMLRGFVITPYDTLARRISRPFDCADLPQPRNDLMPDEGTDGIVAKAPIAAATTQRLTAAPRALL